MTQIMMYCLWIRFRDGPAREGGREREKKKRKVLLLFAKLSKRTIEMQEVYILPLKKAWFTAFIAIIKKVEHTP